MIWVGIVIGLCAFPLVWLVGEIASDLWWRKP